MPIGMTRLVEQPPVVMPIREIGTKRQRRPDVRAVDSSVGEPEGEDEVVVPEAEEGEDVAPLLVIFKWLGMMET